MAKFAIVYESRNRQTGTLMQTIDLHHPDAAKLALPKARSKAEEVMRYLARCVEHGAVQRFANHYPAGQAIAWPAGDPNRKDLLKPWCAKCSAMLAKSQKIKSGDKGAATPQRPEKMNQGSRQAPTTRPTAAQARATREKAAAAAPDGKVTSDRKENRQRQRKADEQRRPGPLTVRKSDPTAVGAAMQAAIEKAHEQGLEVPAVVGTPESTSEESNSK